MYLDCGLSVYRNVSFKVLIEIGTLPFEWEISKSNIQFQYHVFWLAAGCIMSKGRSCKSCKNMHLEKKSSGAMWSMSCITSSATLKSDIIRHSELMRPKNRKDQKAVHLAEKDYDCWLLWTKSSLSKGESIGIFHDRAASSFSLLPYGQQTAKSRGSGTHCV